MRLCPIVRGGLWFFVILVLLCVGMMVVPKVFARDLSLRPPFSWFDMDPENPPPELVWFVRVGGLVGLVVVLRIMFLGHP